MPEGKLSKEAMEKLMIVGLIAIRKACISNDLSFINLVNESLDTNIAKEKLDELICALSQETEQDFLKYLNLNSSKGGGFS